MQVAEGLLPDRLESYEIELVPYVQKSKDEASLGRGSQAQEEIPDSDGRLSPL